MRGSRIGCADSTFLPGLVAMAYILSPMAVPLALRRAVEQAHHAYHPEAGLHSECSCIICNCTAPPVVHRGSRKSGLSSFCREQSGHPEATTVNAVETGGAMGFGVERVQESV